MAQNSFRNNLKGITGKLILFFSIVVLGVILFTVSLVSFSSGISNRAGDLENSRLPLSAAINQLNADAGLMVSSLEGAAMRKDTLGNLTSLNMRIESGTAAVESKRSLFSQPAQATLDSVKNSLASMHLVAMGVNKWLADNYLKDSPDSAFQASLSQRESSELTPSIGGIQKVLKRVNAHTRVLLNDNEAVISERILQIENASSTAMWMTIIVCVMIFIGIIVAGVLFVNSFRKSLAIPINILDKLVRGEASEFSASTNDEMGVIIEATNKLSNNLQLASTFAQHIGEGDVNFSFQPVSDHDLLGNSLVQMRDKLKNINEADRKRNWVTEGLAKFADIIRRNEDYIALSQTIVSELVKYTQSTLGGMYSLHTEGDTRVLQLTACYAFERKKFIEKTIELGEGLVGQCFLESRTILLTEVPNDYVTITSGLGGANPTSLLLVPFKINDQTEGVIELASFHVFQDYEIEFIERLGEIVASTISNAKTNDQTRKLLSESQQQSEEMRAQEEEMRQNMEEMQATQEQLQRQGEETRKIQERLEVEKSMFQVLMEYLPDRITFKDRNSVVLRINKAKAERFKIRPEEMIGKSDYDYFSKDHADKAFAEEQELINSGIPLINIEEHATQKSGDVNWSSTSRIPFRNDRNEVTGMFIITKDITQLKIAQSSIQDRERIIEQLLENIPVFKYQVDRDGMLRNIWAAKPLHGFDPSSFESRNVKDCLPEVYDMLGQKDLGDTDLIGKGVIEINGEMEIFKHYLFKDSTFDNVYLGFAIKQ